MKIIEQLKAQLEAVGATLDDSSAYALNCDAPSGYVWVANGCTCISIQYATNSQSWLAKAVCEDGMPRLRMGLEKVTDPKETAEHRHNLDDDSWGASDDAPAKIPFPKTPTI